MSGFKHYLGNIVDIIALEKPVSHRHLDFFYCQGRLHRYYVILEWFLCSMHRHFGAFFGYQEYSSTKCTTNTHCSTSTSH